MVGTLKLNLNTSCVGNGANLSLDLSLSLLLPVMINCNKPMTIKIQALLDPRAFVCFVDKELVQNKLALVKKITPIGVVHLLMVEISL